VTVGRIEKMSKSKKNVVDPNQLLDEYGADTTRLFCLFAAPPERDLEWSEQGVEGSFRFLNRVWRLIAGWVEDLKDIPPYDGDGAQLSSPFSDLYRKTHQTIKKVSEDIENRFHFNTAISAVMELVNLLAAIKPEKAREDEKGMATVRLAMETIVLLLAPLVPHIAEEFWSGFGFEGSVFDAAWPAWSEDALAADELTIVVQVNGKLRSRLQVAADAGEESIRKMALVDERIVTVRRRQAGAQGDRGEGQARQHRHLSDCPETVLSESVSTFRDAGQQFGQVP
jgi:leucyl-tRNA synthetase